VAAFSESGHRLIVATGAGGDALGSPSTQVKAAPCRIGDPGL